MQPSLQPFGSIAIFSLKMKTVGLRQPNQQRPQHSHLPLPGMMVPSLCLSSLPALSIRHTVHRDTVSDCTTECGQQKKASNRQQPKSNTRWMWCVLAVFTQSLSRDFTAHFSELVRQGFCAAHACSPHNVCEQHLSHLSWAVLPHRILLLTEGHWCS